MATSSVNKNQGSSGQAGGSKNNNGNTGLLSSNQGSSQQQEKSDISSGFLYSFSPDASDEFRQRIGQFTTEGIKDLDAKLSKNLLGDEASHPFASARNGDVIEVMVPLTMARGDLLAELILLFTSKVPTAVLRECTVGWEEPTWTSEGTRCLLGLVSAIQGTPESFTTSSSPIDLTRLAVWITACNFALSQPGGVKDAHGSVLPTSVGGAKSAAKYLERVFATLRATSQNKNAQIAIATLERVFKLWIKSQADTALALVRKHKISWGTVLNAGAPTETFKKKGEVMTRVKTPSKPSKSPFLSGKERTYLSNLVGPAWEWVDHKRKEWIALKPEEQHIRYKEYVSAVKQQYELLQKLSSSLHAKLGHRKKWIHEFCIEQDLAPKSKKDKSNEFAWTQNFFKGPTWRAPLSMSVIFSPSHYLLDSKYETNTTLAQLKELGQGVTTLIVSGIAPESTKELWIEWVDRFVPDFSQDTKEVEEDIPLTSKGKYAVLGGEDKSSSLEKGKKPQHGSAQGGSW